MRWMESWRADPQARPVADRHYNRQSPGSDQFVPPGRCAVLRTVDAGALWVTSWPFAEYVKHAWAGAWINSTFRNERRDLYRSSELIGEAISATRAIFGEPPSLGMVTFIDERKIRHKRDPGRCYLKAGFQHEPCRSCHGTGEEFGERCPDCGGDGHARTKEERLLVLRMHVADMPDAIEPIGFQRSLL